jgi:hypothetical protein
VKATARQAHDRAEAMFKRKEAQLRDAPLAMAEYHARSRAVREQMARLRALRLARDADDAKDAPRS